MKRRDLFRFMGLAAVAPFVALEALKPREPLLADITDGKEFTRYLEPHELTATYDAEFCRVYRCSFVSDVQTGVARG